MKKVRFNLQMAVELRDWLKKVAKSNNVSMAAVICNILRKSAGMTYLKLELSDGPK